MNEPTRYIVYYDDAAKVAALQARHGDDYEPHPSAYRSSAEVRTLREARTLARRLLASGHLIPQVFERVNVRRYEDTYDWDEEFVADLDVPS